MSIRSLIVCLSLSLCLPALADFIAGMAAFNRGDYETARDEWLPLAEGGLVEAQYNLGLLYYNGKGMEVDYEEALHWYLQAAEQDYVRAQYRVAEMYEAGRGTRRDLVQAYFWFRVAAGHKYEDSKKRKRRVADRMSPEQIALGEMKLRHRKRDADEARKAENDE